ncbi:MAG: LPXTG cell wall anchor domain-containing protein [Flavobacteriaceae bacterium]|nr:LPXTG cell wall anchor domain-containing protein [Flavobacteriaceae bacterium]
MKILRFVLVFGGIALIGYGLYSLIGASNPETINGVEGTISQQVLGMLGIGILAILAGVFMRRRR